MAKTKKSKADAPRRWKPTALSRLIDRRIKELDIKQADLAHRLHVHASYVSQLVAGRLPDLDAPGFVERYSAALEMSPEVFSEEAELWRYNVAKARAGELSPARRFLLAVTEHLDDETVHRIARGVREQYGEPPPAPPLVPGQTDEPPTTDASAPPHPPG